MWKHEYSIRQDGKIYDVIFKISNGVPSLRAYPRNWRSPLVLRRLLLNSPLYFKKHFIEPFEKTFVFVKTDWRKDLQMHEDCYLLFGKIAFYRYRIRRMNKLKTSFSLFHKKDSQRASYLAPITPTIIKIGKQELEEKYKGNRWLVPMNLVYDERLP